MKSFVIQITFMIPINILNSYYFNLRVLVTPPPKHVPLLVSLSLCVPIGWDRPCLASFQAALAELRRVTELRPATRAKISDSVPRRLGASGLTRSAWAAPQRADATDSVLSHASILNSTATWHRKTVPPFCCLNKHHLEQK